MDKNTASLAIGKLLILALSLISSSVLSVIPGVVDGKQLPSLAPMLDQVTPAVVNIATEGKIQVRLNPLFSDPFFRRFFNVPDQTIERKTQSLGSGVIVDAERGLVLTNNHVIANAIQITVTLRDGRQLEAELIGTDPETDVAVIKIPSEDIVDIKTADSDELRVGDFVVAIGNPFGLGQTVTSGIVSALSRSGLGIEGYEDFIQTDASINPGNSGGALVNLRGELVGINTALFSQGGGNIGIGFAIPINLAMQITEQLLKNGKVQRGFLGVSTQDLNPALIEAFGLKQKKGAVITSVVEDSPAGEAGLQPGDILIKINGRDVKNASDVRNRFGLLTVGEQVVFDILRGGQSKKITTTVTAEKEEVSSPQATNKRLDGVIISELGSDHRYFGKVEGIHVADVQRGSPAWRSGLRKGDVITSVNRQTVKDVQMFLKKVGGKEEPLLLRILRGNAAAFIVIK
ncbi:MAG: DegQ family serine endoprotease [Proteobacteria bacterium]|nr:DegQ family serine endoprotease [Pseudomonadota bacterium]